MKRNDWENPQVVGINKRMGHVRTVPFFDEESAVLGRYSASPYFQVPQWGLGFSLSALPWRCPRGFLRE